ncbi:Uncharacterised protein [Plesiomonas shigelloides]|nr:Uncharacterised protein [Plesiomonas shigelloides]
MLIYGRRDQLLLQEYQEKLLRTRLLLLLLQLDTSRVAPDTFDCW